MTGRRYAGFVVACLAILYITASSVFAETIYTTPLSDGVISHIDHSEGDRYGSVEVRYDEELRTDTYASAVWRDIRYESGSPADYWSYSYNYDGQSSYAVLQFPISALRERSLAPNSVKLHFYGNSLGTSTPTVRLFGADFDGGGVLYEGQDGYAEVGQSRFFYTWTAAGTITYHQVSTSCSNAADLVGYVPVSATAGWQEMDVTADLQRQINAGYRWASYFFSIPQVWDGHSSFEYRVATYEDAAHRPYLEVTPEPSSFLMLGTGLAALGGLIRRKK